MTPIALVSLQRTVAARRRAFTLIELLTVIAIIGILAAIIIPTVSRVRATAAKADCASNIRQIGVALLLYAQDNKNTLPPVSQGAWPVATDQSNAWGRAIWSYVGYSDGSFNPGVNDLRSGTAYQSNNLFQCRITKTGMKYVPGVDGVASAWSSYGLNDGPLYVTGKPTRVTGVPLSSVENVSKAAMLLESRFFWAGDYAYKTQFGLIPHGDATNVAFYDGHVELMRWPDIQAKGGQERLFWSGRGAP